jgi:hypothetical protein
VANSCSGNPFVDLLRSSSLFSHQLSAVRRTKAEAKTWKKRDFDPNK